jgi:hypothetical protein
MNPKLIMNLKLLSVIFAVLLCACVSLARSESAKITWKQAAADQASLKEWIIYSGDSASTVMELTRIPYTGQPGTSYTSTVPVTITGVPGAKVRKYFALVAVSKNNNVTAKVPGKTAAGVDYLEFTVGFSDASLPFDVLIEVVIAP